MNKGFSKIYILLLFCPIAVSAKEADVQNKKELIRDRDPMRYTQGLRLYQQNCAACHGKQGQGDPNWRQRDVQGKFLPPPLNGTGHTWHHPMYVLKDIIRNGTAKFGGNMPAWKDRLTEKQIDLIIFWVQSQWPDEIYRRWQENDRAVRENMKK